MRSFKSMVRSRVSRRGSSSSGVGGRTMLANSPLASCPSHQGPNQHLPIYPIGLGAPVPAVHRNRRGLDNMAFDSVFDKQPVNPESVQAGLLNNRDRDRCTGSLCRRRLKTVQKLKKRFAVASDNNMLRKLLASRSTSPKFLLSKL